jgi:hypothetical protein
MGAVVYFALVSGLVLLGANPATTDQASNNPKPSNHIQVYWIIAFLAGFSDKFYLGIIDLLVEKTFRVGGQQGSRQTAGDRRASPDRTSARARRSTR